MTVHEIKSMVRRILHSNSENSAEMCRELKRELDRMCKEGRISDSEYLLALLYAIEGELNDNEEIKYSDC